MLRTEWLVDPYHSFKKDIRKKSDFFSSPEKHSNKKFCTNSFDSSLNVFSGCSRTLCLISWTDKRSKTFGMTSSSSSSSSLSSVSGTMALKDTSPFTFPRHNGQVGLLLKVFCKLEMCMGLLQHLVIWQFLKSTSMKSLKGKLMLSCPRDLFCCYEAMFCMCQNV